MTQPITKDSILKLIREREVVLANPPDLLQNPREVYKDKKIKRNNYVSRKSEEKLGEEVSSETCPLAGGLSDIKTSSLASPSLESEVEEVVVGNIITPASTTSRELTGISAQHCISTAGVKVSLTIQTAQDAQDGSCLELTAELKRHSRLRELKPYIHDSEHFDTFYRDILAQLKELKPAEGKNMCIGRVHSRGKRSAWFADIAVVGRMDDAEHIEKIFVYYNGEEYEIDMNQDLSPRQKELYHTTGIFGHLKTINRAPTIATAERKSFRG